MTNTEKFTGLATTYARHRPTYPRAAIDALALAPGAVVADLGAGTGIFSRLLAAAGARVLAVEPNADMRAAFEPAPGVTVVDGTAEATTLADASVDVVTVAQAFHWFDVEASRREMRRIARPDARVALLWNSRVAGPFADELDAALVRHIPGNTTTAQRADERTGHARALFGDAYTRTSVDHAHRYTLDELHGWLGSFSYVPRPGAPNHVPLFADIHAAFDRHVVDGAVSIPYRCDVYIGAVGDWPDG